MSALSGPSRLHRPPSAAAELKPTRSARTGLRRVSAAPGRRIAPPGDASPAVSGALSFLKTLEEFDFLPEIRRKGLAWAG